MRPHNRRGSPESLKDVTQLEKLDLTGPVHFTDAGLKHLSGLTRLRELSLMSTHVGDAGLVAIKGMTCLEVLDVCGSLVTDAGLANLEGLTRLRRLAVGRGTEMRAGRT